MNGWVKSWETHYKVRGHKRLWVLTGASRHISCKQVKRRWNLLDLWRLLARRCSWLVTLRCVAFHPRWSFTGVSQEFAPMPLGALIELHASKKNHLSNILYFLIPREKGISWSVAYQPAARDHTVWLAHVNPTFRSVVMFIICSTQKGPA
jgi:hypothetical protein